MFRLPDKLRYVAPELSEVLSVPRQFRQTDKQMTAPSAGHNEFFAFLLLAGDPCSTLLCPSPNVGVCCISRRNSYAQTSLQRPRKPENSSQSRISRCLPVGIRVADRPYAATINCA